MMAWLATIGGLLIFAPPIVSGSPSCGGFEEQWAACNGNVDCGNVCHPQNCKWDDWSDWADMGGCFGLCSRQRGYAQLNNECGQACEGNKSETKNCTDSAYFSSTCHKPPEDCQFSHWSEWSACRSLTDQKVSVRAVYKFPAFEGKPCGNSSHPGSIKRTAPCASPDLNKLQDCEFSDWTNWTTCSVSCDGGHQTRTRRVSKQADVGGHGCNGTTSETQLCGTTGCATAQDCEFNDWSKWSDCVCETSSGPCHRTKTRGIKSMATGSGKPCADTTRLSQGCTPGGAGPTDCTYHDWQDWAQCTKTCGGGQTQRFRTQANPAANGGSCSKTATQEIGSCKTDPCPHSCEYKPWSEWSVCQPACGVGTKTKTREIATPSWGNCHGELKVAANCSTDCGDVDCKWSTWDDWSVCSRPCNGGTRQRNRRVERPPQHDGKKCEAWSRTEIAPCNNQHCNTTQCINGTFSTWSNWTTCSATCDKGYQTRSRHVNSVPNHCGFPAIGNTSDVKACDNLLACTTTKDCILSDWSSWSKCSDACYGMTERNRTVAQYAHGLYGKGCGNHALKESQMCNPLPGQAAPATCPKGESHDCVMDEWNQWSACSVSCGGGQKKRGRTVLTYPSGAGSTCANATYETAPCLEQKCLGPPCIDCKWGDWGPWSKCSDQCPYISQQYRNREITQHPNWCGNRCPANASSETAACENHCQKTGFCVWAPWSLGTCDYQNSGSCGSKVRTNIRNVTYSKDWQNTSLIGEGNQSTCKGVERTVEICPGTSKSCVGDNAVDCSFSTWSDWSKPPSCDEIFGLCSRNRNYTLPRFGGKVCVGSLSETKHCKKPDCSNKKDCVLAQWSHWSTCSADQAHIERKRAVQEPAADGGAPCNGSISEVKSCPSSPSSNSAVKQNCELSEWGSWADCSKSCAGGVQGRSRTITKASAGGGAPCGGALAEVQGCHLEFCGATGTGKPTNCVFGDWSPYTVVGAGGNTVPQRKRTRTEKVKATNGGIPCNGSLEELAPPEPVNCLISQWGAWDACDSDCENGQQTRTRHLQHQPKYGGVACSEPLDLQQVQGCSGNLTKCTDPGYTTLTTWSDWSHCTTTCGSGQQTRTRGVKNPGVGFRHPTEPLKETRSCPDQETCNRGDCKWADWEAWKPCSRTCAGGHKTRHRQIAVPPTGGGYACAQSAMEQVVSCNNDVPCHAQVCQDGVWEDWQEWGACSASCRGGLSHRNRQMKTAANHCGAPLTGNNTEFKSCNAGTACGDSNCTYSEWTQWSTCPSQCDGIQSRHRSITNPGEGTGTRCSGGLKDVQTCNPSASNPVACKKFIPVDCQWAMWSISDCSTTCSNSRGHQQYTRHVAVNASGGGKPCQDSEVKILPCSGLTACDIPPPVDCKWADWSAWSACDKCENGQRTRTRNIVQTPAHGGKPCLNGTNAIKTSSESKGCSAPELCQDTTCGWADWADWSACSRSCKGGRKMRRRALKLTKTINDVAKRKRLYSTYQELRQHLDENGSQRWVDLSAAFCGGCVIFFLGAVVLRKFRGSDRVNAYSLLSRIDQEGAVH